MGAARYFVLFLFAALAFAAMSAPSGGSRQSRTQDKWELKFTENFNGKELSNKLWRRIEGDPNQGADWQKNISPREDLAKVYGGVLTLKGVKNADLAADSRRVLCGGISTKGLLDMKYGKIEVRAKFEGQKGAWPAIWMLPEHSAKGWPHDGEIDILEHLNYDGFVYQTVHSTWAEAHPDSPPRMGKGLIKPESWNVYTLEWTPEKIVWRINGKATHEYPKVADSTDRWPWDRPFYLIMDMQLGGKWVGEVDEITLPVSMQIDWVKIYSLSRGGKRISEFSRPR